MQNDNNNLRSFVSQTFVCRQWYKSNSYVVDVNTQATVQFIIQGANI